MPKAHPHTSVSSSLRRIALNTHDTIMTPSASSPNFTSSHTPNTRTNHGTPANTHTLGIHDICSVRMSNISRTDHERLDGSKHSSSPKICRTLSSGLLLIYLRDTSLTDRTVEELRSRLVGPLGFDIEYRPNFIKGRPLNRTALVQLASDSIVLLVQVSAMPTFPESLRRIMEDPTIIKAGVGIQGDADKLWQDFGVNLASCLELSYLARAVDHKWSNTNGLISLTRLVKAYEDRDLRKPKHIQLSNWESSLTDKQQDYAAQDATAALSVLQELYAILPSIQPPPTQSLYLFK